MPIVFTCPRCDRKYSVSDAMAGRRATCKSCGQEQTIPKAAATPPASSARALTDFDELDAPEDDDSSNPYAQDFDDVPASSGSRAYAGQTSAVRAKPKKARRSAAPSALAEINLGSWIGGYYAVNATAFLIAMMLQFTTINMFDPAIIKYGQGMVFLLSSLVLVLVGLYGVIVVSINEGPSNIGRPLALCLTGALTFGLLWFAVDLSRLAAMSGNTERAQKVIALLRQEVGLLKEMNTVLDGIDGAESAQAAAPTMFGLQMKANELRAKGQELGKLTRAEDRYVAKTALPEFQGIGRKVIDNLKRLNALPGSDGRMGADIARMEAMLNKMEEAAKAADTPATKVNLFGAPPGLETANGPQGDPNFGPDKGVVVRVSGLDEEAKWKVFGDKLGEAAKQQSTGGNHSIAMFGDGNQMVFQVGPSRDAKELAALLTFAHVDDIKDNVIYARSDLKEADLAAVRAQLAEEKARRDAQSNNGAMANNAPAPGAPNKPEADLKTIDGALDGLKGLNGFKVRDAVKRLSYGVPEDRKAEVVAALTPLLSDSDVFTSKETLETLVKLRVPESVPAIIEILDRKDLERDAAEALGKFRDVRAAKALADHLETAWPVAQRALVAIGPQAESAVIGKLRDPESRVRSLACEVLEEIGGVETLNTMKKMPADPDPLVRMTATSTMKKIAERTGAMPENNPFRPPTRKGR